MAYLEVGRIYAVVGMNTLVRIVSMRGQRVVVRRPSGVKVAVSALLEFRRATVAQERGYWKEAFDRLSSSRRFLAQRKSLVKDFLKDEPGLGGR